MLPAALEQQLQSDGELQALIQALDLWRDAGDIDALDRQVALFCCRHAQAHPIHAAVLGLTLSRLRRDGHVCLDLSARPSPLAQWADSLSIEADLDRLLATGLTGAADSEALFVVEPPRIWLRRSWRAEVALAEGLRSRLHDPAPAAAGRREDTPLDPLQQQAVERARSGRLCVVSGGPGTGKTTVAAEMIAGLVADGAVAPERIALAAPTGKAAARLQSAVGAALAARGLTVDLGEARTLHRLLRWSPSRRQFQHGPESPLAADLVLIDEASMVDLELMSALVSALHRSTRLVLLGDRDQLASVSPGSVLADICQGLDRPEVPGSRRIVALEKSFRFAPESGIGRLARAIRGGEGGAALDLLHQGADDLSWVRPGALSEPLDWLTKRMPQSFLEGLSDPEPGRALAAAERFRILCAQRGGPLGVRRFNHLAAEALRRAGVLMSGPGGLESNRLILVNRNDYRLGVFNGDIGLVRFDDQDDPEAWFAQGAGARPVPARRLAATESAFALTVHKSQGSEYDQVIVVLPEAPSPLLTRELLYTAVTRARIALTVVASETALRQAVAQTTLRFSGLAARLWDESGKH